MPAALMSPPLWPASWVSSSTSSHHLTLNKQTFFQNCYTPSCSFVTSHVGPSPQLVLCADAEDMNFVVSKLRTHALWFTQVASNLRYAFCRADARYCYGDLQDRHRWTRTPFCLPSVPSSTSASLLECPQLPPSEWATWSGPTDPRTPA